MKIEQIWWSAPVFRRANKSFDCPYFSLRPYAIVLAKDHFSREVRFKGAPHKSEANIICGIVKTIPRAVTHDTDFIGMLWSYQFRRTSSHIVSWNWFHKISQPLLFRQNYHLPQNT